MKAATDDMLGTLASLEFEAEYNSDHEHDIGSDAVKSSARNVAVFRMLAREAGYEVPSDFDWQKHFAR